MKDDIIKAIVGRLMLTGMDQDEADLMLIELLMHLQYQGDISFNSEPELKI